MSRSLRQSALVLCALFVATGAFAQAPSAQKPYQPEVGQEGKDVVWVPTSEALVQKMLDLAQVTPKDFVIDLGSGDGRTVIAAAKRGARAMGIEYNPDMVELSKANAAKAGVSNRAAFAKADLFETDFSRATVITMFLLPSINMKLRPKLLDLKPGTRIVSNTFTMEDWEPDDTAKVDDTACGSSWCTALLWIVPAKVEGKWELPQGELSLTQQFQMVSGTFTLGGRNAPISGGRLRGDEISFTAGGVKHVGHVNGNTMQGTIEGTSQHGTWSATRATTASLRP